MAKTLSKFSKIRGLEGIFSAENGNLRCCAILLASGGLAVISPVRGLGQQAIASLAALGSVEYLVAPNHYHNTALAEYRQEFPNACVCAPPDAIPRLEKVTGFRFSTLDGLNADLPNTMHQVYPQGLKTGELWITVAGSRHHGWLVVDGFSGPKGGPNQMASEPEFLKTFPKYGISDADLYRRWVQQRIETDPPTMIVPCHGRMICSSDLATRLHDLIERELGRLAEST